MKARWLPTDRGGTPYDEEYVLDADIVKLYVSYDARRDAWVASYFTERTASDVPGEFRNEAAAKRAVVRCGIRAAERGLKELQRLK